MLEDLDKVIAGLRYWNLHLNPKETYSDRFLIQKLTYLCDSLGIKMKYHFGLYVAGPYCSRLADDYYAHSQRITSLTTEHVPSRKEEEIFMKIQKHILSKQVKGERRMGFIEAVATIQKLFNDGFSLYEDELHFETKKIKPHLSDYIITIALNTVKQLNFKPEYYTKEIQEELENWDKI